MATQNSGFEPVNFSITTPFHNVRLMEITEDILSIIEGEKDKSNNTTTLKFKSAPASTVNSSLTRNSSTSKAKDSVLHLCSNDKAWAIKQVSTSNSVYLVQPCTTTTQTTPESRVDNIEDAENTSDPLKIATRGSVTATSQVRNFLELHPVKIDEAEIESSIEELVSLFQNAELLANMDPIFQTRQNTKQTMSLLGLIANVASPDPIVRKVCARLGVFEALPPSDQQPSPTSPQCYIPSATALFAVWAKIIEICAIELIKLDHAINEQRIADALTIDTDKAIARAMLEPHGMLEQRGLIESAGAASTNSAESTSASEQGEETHSYQARYLKPRQTVVFIAILLLRNIAATAITTAEGQPAAQIESQSFMRQWTDLVPSSFVKHCTLETLQSLVPNISTIHTPEGTDLLNYPAEKDGPLVSQSSLSLSQSSGESGVSSNTTPGGGSSNSNTSDKTKSSANAASANKRKWHEKFGAQRNAKK